MKEHLENMKKYEETQRREQEKNRAQMRARLEARRKKKQEQGLAKIKNQVEEQADVDERRTQDQLNLINQQGKCMVAMDLWELLLIC